MSLNDNKTYPPVIFVLLKKALKIIVFIFLLIHFNSIYSQENILNQKISLKSQTNTVYRILNQVSRQTSCFFIYDSQVVDGDKTVRIKKGEREINSLLDEILDEPDLNYKIIENYIVIYIPEETEKTEKVSEKEAAEEEVILVSGTVMDEESGEPLAFANINIANKGKGIISNMDGKFSLKMESIHLEDTLRISHLGYINREIPVYLLAEGTHDIYLKRDYISLPEIIVSYYNPELIISEAINARHKMYPQQPTMHTSFYREGVLQGNDIFNYSEAVFNIYKASYNSPLKDAVSVIKSRNITNTNFKDSLLLKHKAGVNSSLELDLIKNTADFLDPRYRKQYKLIYANLVTYNNKDTYAVGFEPANDCKECLFSGTVFVDKESFAIVRIEFEVAQKRLNAAQKILIPRKNPNFSSRLISAKYTVSYKLFNGNYHLNHVRGDVNIRIRRKNHLFGNTYHIFFEMASMSIETDNVSKIKRRERLKKYEVFSDTSFEYDFEFWKDYNFLSPEEEIQKALPKINAIIESAGIEEK